MKLKDYTRVSWKPVPDLPTSISLCLVFTLGLICYYPTIDGEFVFDDSEAVVNNNDVKLTSPVRSIFHNDFWGTEITKNASHKSYRPLTILSFRLNVLWDAGRLEAPHFHLVNLILYCFVCCISLFVFKALTRGSTSSNQVSLVASLLFTVHPIHTEAVGPAVGRADLLSALFLFLAFLSFCQAILTHHHLVFTSVTLFLTTVSMFCKEQGITVLAICSMYDILFSFTGSLKQYFTWKHWNTSKAQQFLVRQTLLITGAFLLLILRWKIMGGTVPTFQKVDNPASFMDNMHLRAINYTYVYALNLWLLFCPQWLCFDWSMGCVPLILSYSDSRIVAITLFIVWLMLLAVSCVRNTKATSRRGCVMAVAFLVVPFLPATNILFRVGFVVAERTLFVPSVGFCLLVTLGLQRLISFNVSHKGAVMMLMFILLVFGVRSHQRILEWRDEQTLFMSALAVCPLNAKVHYNIAKTSTNHTEAVKFYRNALRLNPDYDQAMNNLANILKDNENLLEAEDLLRKALKLRPDFAAAWMNLGIVLAHKKEFVEAEKCYKRAISYRTRYPDCFYNLGNLYLELKQHIQAYESWRQTTLLDPSHHAAWNNIIIMLDSIGRHEEAVEVGREALSRLPDSPSIHFNVANALGKMSEYARAEVHFQHAIKLNPKHPLYFVNLGVLYHHWKKFNLAEQFYLEALKLDPNLKSAKDNLRTLQKSHS